MSGFTIACPTVPVIHGTEVRFSLQTHRTQRILHWPLAHISCDEVIPFQLRSQWGRPTEGARYDSYSGLRLGSPQNNLTVGMRSTYAGTGSRLGPVERQRVGVASLTLGGIFQFKYWNDHRMWWWPMGGGTDQGDTAGIRFSFNVAPLDIALGAWGLDALNLTMRLATGIPNRASAQPMGDGSVYTEVAFAEVDRGDIDLSASFGNRKAQRLEIGLLVNAGVIRDRVQNQGAHGGRIPHVPGPDVPHAPSHLEAMVYFRLSGL